MTDRHAGYVVTLEEDIREDFAEPTIEAIKQIKGVLDVEPVVSGPDVQIAENRAKREIINQLGKLARDY